MNKVFALTLLFPLPLLAAGPFDGNWVTDESSFHSTKASKPLKFTLIKGDFVCPSCSVKAHIPADGAFHPVTGSPYYDAERITVVDDHTIEIVDQKAGKTVTTITDKVSEDGKTITGTYDDETSGNGIASTGTDILTRVSAGPAGSHIVSGSWRLSKATNGNLAGDSFSFESTENGLKFKAGTGETYDAKFDGKQYAQENDPGHTMISLKKINDNKIQETDTRDGKVTHVITMTVSVDGKLMKVVDQSKVSGAIFYSLAKKQ